MFITSVRYVTALAGALFVAVLEVIILKVAMKVIASTVAALECALLVKVQEHHTILYKHLIISNYLNSWLII